MPVVQQFIQSFDRFAPESLGESWDNVGLLVGRQSAAVSSVMTCLTLTPNVAREAIENKVDLIICHHPIMFRPIQQITDSTSEGSMLLELIENQIAVFSPHTRFDSAERGINQQLAESLGLSGIKPIRPLKEPVESEKTLGAGRFGKLPTSVSFDHFCEQVKQQFQLTHLITTAPKERKIQTVGIACGSAAEFLGDAAALGCDAFITGEGRFHTAFEAQALNVGLILMGHYQTERPAMEQLVTVLQREFPDLKVRASASEADPFESR